MRTDSEIKRDVEAGTPIRSDHRPDRHCRCREERGSSPWAGFVRSYSEKNSKLKPLPSALAGVVGLANDLEVRLSAADQRPDPEIARDAVAALRARLPFSANQIRVVLDKGWVTLEGQVEWNYQREEAERGGPQAQRRQRSDQHDPAEAKRGAGRDQTQDRRSLPAQRRDRCEPDHRRGKRRRG